MPMITGIDFIKTLKKQPKIILTTAYKEYAFDAFQLDVDGLLAQASDIRQISQSG